MSGTDDDVAANTEERWERKRRRRSPIAGRAPVHGRTDGRERGFRRAVGFHDGLRTFHVGDAAAGLCPAASGLVGGGPPAGFPAAGLPVRALVFGHGLSPPVDMSPPQGTRWNGQCNPFGRLVSAHRFVRVPSVSRLVRCSPIPLGVGSGPTIVPENGPLGEVERTLSLLNVCKHPESGRHGTRCRTSAHNTAVSGG